MDNVMKEVFMSKSTDNISAIIITFSGFVKFYNQGLTYSNWGQGKMGNLYLDIWLNIKKYKYIDINKNYKHKNI